MLGQLASMDVCCFLSGWEKRAGVDKEKAHKLVHSLIHAMSEALPNAKVRNLPKISQFVSEGANIGVHTTDF